MRPKPFMPTVLNDDKRFVRDQTSDLVWHRVFHRPLYIDTDRSGVVHHANYLRYFELGRSELMRDLGYPYREVEADGFVYPIIELGNSYYQPLQYDDPMWVHTRPAQLERVRVRFDYLITNADSGEVLCQGFTRHCCLGSSGKPAPIDEQTTKFWQSFPS